MLETSSRPRGRCTEVASRTHSAAADSRTEGSGFVSSNAEH
jgi:hypothetical protein